MSCEYAHWKADVQNSSSVQFSSCAVNKALSLLIRTRDCESPTIPSTCHSIFLSFLFANPVLPMLLNQTLSLPKSRERRLVQAYRSTTGQLDDREYLRFMVASGRHCQRLIY